MIKRIFICILVCTISLSGFTQGELEEQGGIFAQNEKSLGLSLNSNGFALDFRYGKKKSAERKNLFEGTLANVKHPKEIKSHHPLNDNESFVFGKLNNFITLKLGVGRQRELFSKFDRGSIAVRYFLTGGASLGFLKPIYYEVQHKSTDNKDEYYVNEKFDPEKHHTTYDIYGKAPFFEGMNEIKLIPGVYGKFGFNFEYSKSLRLINALEAGVIVEAFLSEVPIMANDESDRFFVTLFLTYRIGKLFSPRLKNVDNP